MRIALFTSNFDPNHTVVGITMFANGCVVDGLPVARPTTAGIVFVFGNKQRCATTNTIVNTFCIKLVILAGKRTFGAALAGDAILFRRELRPPFLIGFHRGSVKV